MTSIDFRALYLANKERSAYGLRYNDNERYRKHCANKVHRLRSSLKVTHGKGKEFKKLPPLKLETTNVANLQLYLFESERLYAYAQELYQAGEHHKAVAKHRRCLTWADRLLALCQQFPTERLTASNLSEVLVYVHILRGRFLLKRDQFDLALIHLSVTHGLLTHLSGSSQSSRDQALANEFIDEISPEIRYCAHEMKQSRSHDVQRIVNDVSAKESPKVIDNYPTLIRRLESERTSSTGVEKKSQLKPWVWQETAVPVRTPELVDVLLKVQQAEYRIAATGGGPDKYSGKARMVAYDAVLQAWSEAEGITRKLVEARQITASSTLDSANSRDATFVYSFVMFHLLQRRVERDLILVSALLLTSSRQKGAADSRLNSGLCKLLNAVLQSLNQMRSLSIVEESPDLATELEACLSYTRARRCLYLAQSYAWPSIKRYGEALALSQRGLLHLREASSNLSLIDAGGSEKQSFTPSQSNIEKLDSNLREDESRFKRDWFAFNGGEMDHQIGNLHHKPLFFDIALNYIDVSMDGLRGKAGYDVQEARKSTAVPIKEDRQVEEEAPPVVSTSRFGNLLSSWWGR